MMLLCLKVVVEMWKSEKKTANRSQQKKSKNDVIKLKFIVLSTDGLCVDDDDDA
jgi:hypothetical protein